MDSDTNTRSNALTAASIARSLKIGISGPLAVGEIAYEHRKTLSKGILGLGFLLLIPILFLCMLPSFIFNGYSSSETINSQTAMIENLHVYQMAVWSALDEIHTDILIQIQNEIDNLKENEIGVLSDSFSFGKVNTMLILSQYSVAMNIENIEPDGITEIIKNNAEKLFSYQVSTSSSEDITTYTYTVNYAGDSYFADYIFMLNDKEKKLALDYADNLQIFLYGSISGTVTSQVSEKVLSYSSLVVKYAEKYGISGFIDVIYAVMMAESGGNIPDVMQASECPYNTKFPNEPNGITDPEYSIDVGVHYLSDCLNGAGCTSPSQTDKLSLALQGYNFGNGYISWALDNYGGYSEANAIEFSKMMQEKLGWNRYGNPKYVSAVFKYLLFSSGGTWGSPFIGRNWNSVVSSEFGYRTDPLNGSSAFHEGLDIAFPTGTDINAVSGGVVTNVVFSKTGYGNHIRIDCGNGVTVLYAHCSEIFVTKGQSIASGQVIAKVGATGRVTGPHLHLGILVNGKEVNPREYISQ